MPLFGSRRSAPSHSPYHRTQHRGGGLFHRKDRDRVAGGLKASLANPNTTHAGRKQAKRELRAMGRDTHVPLMTKIKRTLGIRSTPRRARVIERTRY